MSWNEPTDVCLQCGQSRAQVKANDTICGIEGGYEYRELEAGWERHHWRDWSNRELSGLIKPEAFDKYRRTPALHLQWADCEDTVYGHIFPARNVPEWAMDVNICMMCGFQRGT